MAKLEDLTVEDVCQYLDDRGFSDQVIRYVKDEELDGDAIGLGLASDPGPSWLKDIIPKMGLRLKVHNVLRSLYLESQISRSNLSEVESPSPDLAGLLENEIPVYSAIQATPVSSVKSTVHSDGTSVSTSNEVIPLDDYSVEEFELDKIRNQKSCVKPNHIQNQCKSSKPGFTERLPKQQLGESSQTAEESPDIHVSMKSFHNQEQPLPEPFPIPTFRAATEKNLSSKKRADSDRKYMVQTLSTMLMTFKQKPSLSDCGKVAKALVTKFAFLKDDEGDGEHSWKWFIYYRCNNVNRSTKEDSLPRTKRVKLEDSASHLYPIHDGEDSESFKRNSDLLNQEMQKPSRRPEVIKTLLSRTFPNRWNKFVNENQPETLADYIREYPVLKKSNYVALEFSLATKKDNIRDDFEEAFPLWAKAIVLYCKNSQQKNSVLRAETVNYSDDIDQGQLTVMALRCLFVLLSPLKTKKINDDGSIPFILNIVPRGTLPSVGDNNQPYIVNFADEDHVLHQYFISVEHDLMMECSSLSSAIFYCIAAHYIFNLTYHAKTGDVWTFIQEKVLQIQSKVKGRRSPSTISHFAGITSVHETLN